MTLQTRAKLAKFWSPPAVQTQGCLAGHPLLGCAEGAHCFMKDFRRIKLSKLRHFWWGWVVGGNVRKRVLWQNLDDIESKFLMKLVYLNSTVYSALLRVVKD